MKRAAGVAAYGLFVLLSLLPLGTLAAACFGYTVTLVSYPAFAVLTALLAGGTLVLQIAARDAAEQAAVAVVLGLSLPLSLVNAVICQASCNTCLVAVSMLITTACCGCFLPIRRSTSLAPRIIGICLTVLAMWLLVSIDGFLLFFGHLRQETVLQSLASPGGTYYAELIDSDQGALGGSTMVCVYESREYDALLFRLSRKPQTVYSGRWGEFKNMDIAWSGERCIAINGEKYAVMP